ncbi:DUF6160 family protein [Marinobacter sp. M216]|uniref:DUF6160 family protein n=1 Tax=Marinobacter albus TaxID=3030833 RepID=A0ABT7HDV1_9GAMM|nr:MULTISPECIES: DUF6160 family protein [unclassified Marinobacter]MBW7470001.1 hypothetical protein [Marinobacter sp. F4218]MDK9557736.1 DUF6160 family protein [Marinobacter sp. M216]
MKGLNKIALATAIAAAPFAANAELKAMNDSAMGNVTGQAGVTIELETKVSIGQFKYTDEGSFAVNGIVLGGSGVAGGTGTDLLDQLKIDIDVADDGDAIIHVGSLQTDPATGAPVPIDWGMTVDSMELLAGSTGTDSTTLISNMSMHGDLAALDMRVDTATDHLNVAVAFDIDDMDFDVDFLAIGIRDLTVTGAGTNFDYDGNGTTADEELAASSGASAEGYDLTNPQQQLAFGKLTNYANVNLDVYKGAGLGASTAVDVLRVDVNNVYMDVAIGAVEIGGTSIGSVALDNLAVTDTKMAIYGH